jgi:hypothetical protein
MRPLRIVDKPSKINLANYEQRLRRMLTEIRLMAGDLEEALERIEREKKL